MSLSLKPNVRLLGLKPELLVGLMIVHSAFADKGVDCVVTTAVDGVHSHGSEHYTGLALDFRLSHLDATTREAVVAAVRDALGPDFDVLWESEGTPNVHLHVEYDPKQAY